MKNKDPKHFIRSIMIMLVSAFCGSSVQIFVMIPCGMTSGGLPGVVRLITHFAPSLNYSIVYYSISMVILIIVYITIGRAEAGRIVAMVFTYPIMMFIFEKTGYTLLTEADPFLAAVLIGLFYGLATGIGYIGGFSSGGTDSIARVLKLKVFNQVRVANIQMVMDVAILAVSAFVFNMNVALYAIVSSYVGSKVVTAVMLGVSGKFIQFDIIASEPDKCERIADFVMKDIGRAVTSHISTGEYTHSERKTLTVICTPAESVKIKRFVAEADPRAFATIQPINTVWGMDRGFADITEADET